MLGLSLSIADFLLPACILTIAIIAGMLLNKLVSHYLKDSRFAKENSPLSIFIHALKGMPFNWCLIIGLYWTIKSLSLPENVEWILSCLLFTIIVLSITKIFARTLTGIITYQTNKLSDTGSSTSLITNIINVILYAVGIVIILEHYGISIAPMITALGVGGMAVALGLQETFANLFAGLHLIWSNQLRLNDYIRLSSGEEGRVTDITWRFTTVLSTSNNIIVIPNQKLSTAIHTNYTLPYPDVLVPVTIGVAYDSDLVEVERITLEVAQNIMDKLGVKGVGAPAIRFHTFADSAIMFNVNLRTHDFEGQYVLKHEFIKAISSRYKEEGIEIPFPIRKILQSYPNKEK